MIISIDNASIKHKHLRISPFNDMINNFRIMVLLRFICPQIVALSLSFFDLIAATQYLVFVLLNANF